MTNFAKILAIASNAWVAVLVAIIIIGPWQTDPQYAVLLALVARPGDIALGWLLQKRDSRDSRDRVDEVSTAG